MKNEIIEEAKKVYQKALQDNIELSFYDGVNLGAKWQAERMYSEEEVVEVLTQRCKEFGTKNEKFQKLLLKQDLEWFEQNKKK